VDADIFEREVELPLHLPQEGQGALLPRVDENLQPVLLALIPEPARTKLPVELDEGEFGVVYHLQPQELVRQVCIMEKVEDILIPTEENDPHDLLVVGCEGIQERGKPRPPRGSGQGGLRRRRALVNSLVVHFYAPKSCEKVTKKARFPFHE
jgi:hypothetical protein